MIANLTILQKQLCNVLQCGLDIVERPFERMAAAVGYDEATALAETGQLKSLGVLRRIAAQVNFRSLGRVSVLVTAQVPESILDETAGAVSELPGVSHNYLRNHEYNLWFTLQEESESDIEQILHNLGRRFLIEFHPLPALEVFRLDVRFDAFSEGQALLPGDERSEILTTAIKLTHEQQAVIGALMRGIEIVPEPFTVAGMDDAAVLAVARHLFYRGVIRRIAGVVDYRKLGFTANAMLVCAVEESQMRQTGSAMALLNCVSHCYCRRPFTGWPYNLFAMMHGRDMAALRARASAFAGEHGIGSYELLETLKEFKKQPVSI